MVRFFCVLMALAFDDPVLCMDASNNFVEQTDTGASAPSPNQGLNIMQPGAEQFSMKVPNTKVNLFYFSSLQLILRVMLRICTDVVCRLLCSLARVVRLLEPCKASQELVFRFVIQGNKL